MNGHLQPYSPHSFWVTLLRWGFAFLFVIGVYGAVAFSFYFLKNEPTRVKGNPQALMLEFADVPTAPVVEEEADTLQPKTTAQETKTFEPEPEPELDTAPQVLPTPPSDMVEELKKPPELKQKPEPAKQKPLTPPVVEPKKTKPVKPDAQLGKVTQRAQAPSINARAGKQFAAPGNSREQGEGGTADPAWKNKVQAKIDSVARRVARQHPGINGFAVVLFAYDGGGNVTFTKIARSTGKKNADDVALIIARQSSPLPPPPGGKPGKITLRVKF